MKFKVIDSYLRHACIEADTIGNLKASIMSRFSLTADHLSQQRILVRGDDRDLLVDRYPITGCVDLLQQEEATILDGGGGDFLKYGEPLILGWKGPCNVLVVSEYAFDIKYEVDNSFTLVQLKEKIAELTGDPVSVDKLPEVLYNGDNAKPLLFYGYYKFSKSYDIPFEIYCSKGNALPEFPNARVVTYPTQYFRASHFGEDPVEVEKSLSVWMRDADGREHYIPYTDFLSGKPPKYEEEDEKNTENKKRKIQFKENTENQKKMKKKKKKKKKKTNKNNKGMEGDKEAGCSYIAGKEFQTFNKEKMNNIQKMKNKKKKIMKPKDIMC